VNRAALAALVAVVAAACATEKMPPGRPASVAAAANATPIAPLTIVAAADRSERDRALDPKRKPVEMLTFFAPAPGMKVAELGAGGGYTTELLARAVEPNGVVYAENPPDWIKAFLEKPWTERLARPAMLRVVRVDRPFDDPLPPEAKNLDAVYSVAIYHDVIAEKHDLAKMNKAVFDALRPGGVYAIIDNAAKDGSGVADVGTLHRIDEKVVRDQVEAAGFRLESTGDFLRNPQDTRDWNASPDADPRSGTQERFALRFVKPR
jgi:predicted methyltransferase